MSEGMTKKSSQSQTKESEHFPGDDCNNLEKVTMYEAL